MSDEEELIPFNREYLLDEMEQKSHTQIRKKVEAFAWYLERELDWNVFYSVCPECGQKYYTLEEQFCNIDGSALERVAQDEAIEELIDALKAVRLI